MPDSLDINPSSHPPVGKEGLGTYNHFILTRFNIRLWWKEDKAHQTIQTAEWLDERFRLFERYTWPSLQAQTCRDFQWICLFDADTDDAHKAIIERYASEDSRFHPVYVKASDVILFPGIFRYEINRWADPAIGRLLTTYLDNDDALHCRFIEDIQRRATKLKYRTIISYTYGIQYYEKLNMAVRIPYKNNHFLTYYERLKVKNLTVWGFSHSLIFCYKKIRIELVNNRQCPMWVEVIHAGNVDNDVKMTLHHKLLTAPSLMREYGVDITLPGKGRSRRRFLISFSRRFLGQVIRRGKDKLKRDDSIDEKILYGIAIDKRKS